jgi:hypothetical protein
VALQGVVEWKVVDADDPENSVHSDPLQLLQERISNRDSMAHVERKSRDREFSLF